MDSKSTVDEALEKNKGRWFYYVPFALRRNEWDDWEAKIKQRYPIQWFFRMTLYRFFNRLIYKIRHDLYYYIKDYFYPHNVIKLRSLPRSYSDPDLLIEHAVVQLFVDYVENSNNWILCDIDEEIKKFQDDTGREWLEHYRVDFERLKEVYYWAKNEFLVEEPDFVSVKRDKEIEDRTTKMLSTIIELRGHLWD